MIRSARQRVVTLDRIALFENSIAEAKTREAPEDTHPIMWATYIAGMESQLETLKAEVAAYDAATK